MIQIRRSSQWHRVLRRFLKGYGRWQTAKQPSREAVACLCRRDPRVVPESVACRGTEGAAGASIPATNPWNTLDQAGDRLADRLIGGVPRGDGIAINMYHPFPGTGGSHRSTFTYGTRADGAMAPRQALGTGIRDLRRIYQEEGLYTPYIRNQLRELIRKNNEAFPRLFKKPCP